MSVTGTDIQLTLREVKGAALTYAELDDNQTGLKTAIEGHSHNEFAQALGADDNYVTDAEKAALHNHSNKAALDLVINIGDGTSYLADDGTYKPVSAGGVTDHGLLTGLGDDDHTQYLNITRGDARYQPLAAVLTNTTASFTTAQETKLNGIAAGAEVNVNADWDAVSGDAQILNKPDTFAPSAHTTGSHSDWPATVDMTEVGYLDGVTSGIQAQIDSKQATLVSGTNIKTIFGNSLLGSGDLTFQAGMAAAAISTATVAVKDTRYICDTSAGAFTLTLPLNPAAGDYLEIVDAKGTFATNNLTIARNGSVIDGTTEDLVCNIPNIFLTLTYSGNTTRGWQIDLGGEEAIVSPDGDKGDITVSNSGATWTIDPQTVTPAKMSRSGNAGEVLTSNGAGADPSYQKIKQIQSISASVGSNALTISAGTLTLDFRSTTLGSGAVTTVSGTPDNLVISSGSTLGTVNAVQSRIVVLALNNAGTIELAAVNIAGGVNLDETGLISTTAEGGAGAADSAGVVYSTTARTNVAYRVIGYIESTQATAGTWATAPSTIQGYGGQALTAMSSLGYGQTWQSLARAFSTTYYNTTNKPIQISVSALGTTPAGYITLIVNGVTIAASSQSYSASATGSLMAIIPCGCSYSVTPVTSTLQFWYELR